MLGQASGIGIGIDIGIGIAFGTGHLRPVISWRVPGGSDCLT